MGIEIASEEHIPNILRLLAATPNPPNEDEVSIGAILDDRSEIVFVDDVQKTICRLSPHLESRTIPTPWWLWDGLGDFGTRLYPVMRTALLEVLKRHPGAGSWPAFGEFPGVGDTPAEKLASAEVRARTLQTALGGEAAGTKVLVSPANPALWRTESTVAELLIVVAP